MWIVYILRCCDDRYYTGITNNLDKRIKDHEKGAGAKYTRGRGPFDVVYTETHESRSAVSKREFAIKKLSRSQKQQLIAEGLGDGQKACGLPSVAQDNST